MSADWPGNPASSLLEWRCPDLKSLSAATPIGSITSLSIDGEVWVDADQGIWRWGWEDKLLEMEGK